MGRRVRSPASSLRAVNAYSGYSQLVFPLSRTDQKEVAATARSRAGARRSWAPPRRTTVGGQPQADRPWRDTAVAPRPAKGGRTVIRSRFLDYTGVFMLHCHMMNHEDLGMMQTVEVYKD
jgi:FtsP/CotA-like multicopper oxidase with cupredoxin domain